MKVRNINFQTHPWSEDQVQVLTVVTLVDGRQLEIAQLVDKEQTLTGMARYFHNIAVGLFRFEKDPRNADQQQKEG